MLRAGRSEGAGDVHDCVVPPPLQEISCEQPSGTTDMETIDETKKKKAAVSSAAAVLPTKVLFLDGIRGLAAMLVVLQHSKEYMNDVNLGASAVDAFFVLSSFLLTMLFLKKSMKLTSQGASRRKWAFAVVDYFMKRFFRVYPFFALVAVLLWWLPFESQFRFFLVESADKYDLYKVLTFDFKHRYLMLWTLPLEIAYYFCIPVFVLSMLRLRSLWWIALLALQMWIMHDGIYTYRFHHLLLRPHISTFLQGSVAAVIFVKFDAWRKDTGFEFRKWHVVAIRVVEYAMLVLLISECFRALLFEWVHTYLVAAPSGDPFISWLIAYVIVIEMLLPSPVSTTLEWNVLRYWGKISFSLYLLHPFVIYSKFISSRTNYYDRLFMQVALLLLMASTSYYLVEYPLQLMVRRLSQKLAQLEARGMCSSSTTKVTADKKYDEKGAEMA